MKNNSGLRGFPSLVLHTLTLLEYIDIQVIFPKLKTMELLLLNPLEIDFKIVLKLKGVFYYLFKCSCLE